MTTLARLLSPLRPYSLVIGRVILGSLFVWHGLDKFDTGLDNVEAFFDAEGVPLPAVSAPLAAVLEVGAGAALVLGVATRLAALSLTGLMIGALAFVKFEASLLSGPGGAGSELDLAYLAGLVVIAVLGGGTLSVDRAIGWEPSERQLTGVG